MYLGSLVELGDSDELYHNPKHPYTQALLQSIPIPDPKVERAQEAGGDLRRTAQPPQPTQRLRLPHPLPPMPANAAPKRRPSCGMWTAARLPASSTNKDRKIPCQRAGEFFYMSIPT